MPGDSARANGKKGGRPKGRRNASTLAKERGRQAMLTHLTVTEGRVMDELCRLAFSDVRQLFDSAGNLKSIHTLTADESAAIASLEVVIKNAAAGDGHTDTVHKLRVWDKVRSLEMLAKHFGVLTEQVHVTVDVVDILRQRHVRHRLKA